jgi:hypothetical protein
MRFAVRDQLALIADLRDWGFAPLSFMPPEGFSRWGRLRGYDPEAVDQFFDALARQMASEELHVLHVPECGRPDDRPRPASREGKAGKAAWRQYASDCQADWLRFPDLPGVRLRRIRALGKSEITDSYGGVLLTCNSGKTMTLATGQVLRTVRHRKPWTWPPDVVGFVDSATGEPILRISGQHSYEIADTAVLLPAQRFLKFPINGTDLRNAVMMAVNESGATIFWCREVGRGLGPHEIVVSANCSITPELLCAIELAPGWLRDYLTPPG